MARSKRVGFKSGRLGMEYTILNANFKLMCNKHKTQRSTICIFKYLRIRLYVCASLKFNISEYINLIKNICLPRLCSLEIYKETWLFFGIRPFGYYKVITYFHVKFHSDPSSGVEQTSINLIFRVYDTRSSRIISVCITLLLIFFYDISHSSSSQYYTCISRRKLEKRLMIERTFLSLKLDINYTYLLSFNGIEVKTQNTINTFEYKV